MTRHLAIDTIGWGFVLWLIGYLLGIILFPLLPNAVLGWVIMPIGIVLALWVLIRKVSAKQVEYYLLLSVVWTLIAVVLDYFLLVKLFKPADGYYKLDVYLYYTLTFILPLLVGWRKATKSQA